MDNEDNKKIGLTYPLTQLSKSLASSPKRKLGSLSKKPDQWQQVIEGMLTGKLDVGSRQPIDDTPVWATPEVVTGGFVTGSLLAGGDLTNYEKQLVNELGYQQENQRAFLNAYHLSDEGIASLTKLLESKQYRIDVPEEGALLIVAWLIKQGYHKESTKLINEITPYFEKLRFFPTKTEKQRKVSNEVYLQSVGQTIDGLQEISPNKDIIQQKSTVNVWNPFYDKMVSHLLDLFSQKEPIANNFRPPNSDWIRTGLELAKELESLKKKYNISNRFIKNGSQFSKLLEVLINLANNKDDQIPHNYLCQALSRYINKHGVPETAEHSRVRQQQQLAVSGGLYSDIATIVIQRLKKLPQQEGINHYESFCQSITEKEAGTTVALGSNVPRNIVKKVGRSQINSIDNLVKQKYITSGDGIAIVLPQITSELEAASFEDKDLRNLYSSIYQAFRKRRSLLLLNYQSQVKLEEIPWISMIEGFKIEDKRLVGVSKQTLEDIICLAIKNFPHTIIPNKLLQEIRVLIESSKIECPLVDEVAADIFMGGFSPKFSYSAHIAGLLLKESLYSRYYGIDYGKVINNSLSFSERDAKKFSDYCSQLAGDKSDGCSVASNGLKIEQQQIVTTQNLAALFYALDLKVLLEDELIDLPKACFKWVCHRQQIPLDNYHARLVMMKNTAYAWRQMVFYASHLDGKELSTFLDWTVEYFDQQQDRFITRFQTVINGFSEAVKGKNTSSESRFLGWTVGEHPLLPGN